MQVTSYFCSTQLLRDEGRYAALFAAMPPARRSRVASMRQAEDRRRSVAAWGLLAFALRAHGLSPERQNFVLGPYGKPALESGALCFSLSHAGDLALCAVSERELGADVARPVTCQARLAARICAPAELRWLDEQADADTAFSTLWARKESLLKAAGLGVGVDLRGLVCAPEAPAVYRGLSWYFSETLLGQYPACVCMGGEAPEVIWQNTQL